MFGGYGRALVKSAAEGDFAAFDMSMSILPAFFLSAAELLVEIVILILALFNGDGLAAVWLALLRGFGGMYLTLFLLGALTTATEWRHIHAAPIKKVWYTMTFPVFMFTYLPISLCALFAKAEWKPIYHTVSAAALDDPAA